MKKMKGNLILALLKKKKPKSFSLIGNKHISNYI